MAADILVKNPSLPSQLTGQAESTLPSTVSDYLSWRYIQRSLEEAIGTNLWDIMKIAISIVLILLITIYLARLVDSMLKRHLPKISRAGGAEVVEVVDETFHTITRRLLVAFVYTVGILTAILQVPQLHSLATAMLAGAGLATVAIGLAAQESLSNIISGIFIAIFKPIRIGDYVDFDGQYGQIEDLTLRHTVVCTWDLKRIIVPNSVMGRENIVNWSINDPEVIWPVDIGIAYTADIDKARSIILREAMNHPYVMKDEEINIRVTELGDFAVNLRLTFHVPHRDDAFSTGCEIREAVKKSFDAEGIEIPYPYHNVILQKAS
ncbi:MAG: mechanosensitive ion channel family protein [Methanotrichaceae archaeon]|nr:mechanosensitive ion channel family protein [Methanotrichaceae archaeon]